MNINFLTNNDHAGVSSNHVENNNNIENNTNATTVDDNKIQPVDTGSAINQPQQLTGSNELSSRNATQENQPTQQVLQSKEIQDPLLIEAQKILDENFKDRDFDFAKFAALHNIKIDQNYKPHSDVIKNAFRLMHRVVNDLLLHGIHIEIERGNSHSTHVWHILQARTVIDINNDLNDNDKAYALYDKLANTIFDTTYDKLDKEMRNNGLLNDLCFKDSYKSLLRLPLWHNEHAAELRQLILCAKLENSKIKHDTMQQLNPEMAQLYKDGLGKFGTWLFVEDEKVIKEVLHTLAVLANTGMPIPSSITALEITDLHQPDGKLKIKASDLRRIGNLAHDDCNAITINASILSEHPMMLNGKSKKTQQLTIQTLNGVVYHESTHSTRYAVGAIDKNEPIANKPLTILLKGRYDVLSAIKNQVSFYSLTDNEEFLAEFSARILCILEQGANPFDYIYDERLWRLYYEFGGPDYVNTMIKKGFISEDILSSDKEDKWSLSGYPSKFNIDISKIENQQVEVEGLIAWGVKSNVAIDEKTILPPPPLGYCYTTETGRLQLKINKEVLPDSTDKTLYEPVFCSLTDGPLTLMYAEDRSDPDNPKPLKRNFALLPVNIATRNASGLSCGNTTQDANDAISDNITEILDKLIINIWDDANKSCNPDDYKDTSDDELAQESGDVSGTENSSGQVADDFWTMMQNKILQHKDILEQFLLQNQSDQYSRDFVNIATKWSELPQELSPDLPKAKVKNWMMQIVDKLKKSEQEVPSKTGDQPSKDSDNN